VNASHTYYRNESTFNPDSKQCLKFRIGHLIADVLVLTLFTPNQDSQSLPMIAYPDFRSEAFEFEFPHLPKPTEVNGIIAESPIWLSLIAFSWWRIFKKEIKLLRCSPQAIFHHAMNLIGHRTDLVQLNNARIILSSRDGQVVYPAILGNMRPRRLGYLQLLCRTGRVYWEDNVVSGIQGRNLSSFDNIIGGNIPTTVQKRRASASHLDKTLQTRGESQRSSEEYIPTIRPDGNVHFHLYMDHKKMEYLQACVWHTSLTPNMQREILPWDLIYGLSYSVFTPPCCHNDTSPTDLASHGFSLVTLDSILNSEQDISNRILISLHGQPHNQLLQLARTHQRSVFHNEGCIDCTLKFANKFDIGIVFC
jgi:hypothetical protein